MTRLSEPTDEEFPDDHPYREGDADAVIHAPEPVPGDVYQERADRDDLSRAEAKRRTLTEAYGGDLMLITPEPLASELQAAWRDAKIIPGATVMDDEVVFPELAADPTDAPRTLRDILFTHRALAAAKALEITELLRDIVAWSNRESGAVAAEILPVIMDARQQRDNARGLDRLFSGCFSTDPAGYEAQWVKANPGLVALLQAVDGA